MSTTRKNNKISGGYKPLVAASLAVALGVSVSNAAIGDKVTASVEMPTAQTISNGIDVDSTTKGGLVFEITTNDQALKLGNTLTIEAIAGGNDKNAYSILVGTANTKNFAIEADATQSILVSDLPTTSLSDGKAYVFANNSANTVTFNKVNLTVNGATVADKGAFGLYTGLNGAKYDFGSTTGAKTVFTGITNETPNSTTGHAGDAATGIIVADNATIAGNLEFASFAGQNAKQDAPATATSGKGGNAYGISGEDGKTLTLAKNTVITFKELKGGKGEQGQAATSSTGGAGGDVAGIYLEGSRGLNISGEGKIVFEKLTAGEAGTAGQDDAKAGDPGKVYVINNTSTDKTLTIKDTTIVAETPASSSETTRVAAEGEGTTAIVSKLADVNYAFGSTTGKTALSRTVAGGDAAGVKFTGIEIGANATLGGNLDVTGQNGGTASTGKRGQKGGDAVGILLSDGTLTAKTLFLSVTGGNGSAKESTAADEEAVDGQGGAATGIATSGTTGANIAGGLTINLVSGQDGDGSTRDATLTAIDNKMTGAEGVLTFDSGSSLTVKSTAASGNYGISNEIAGVVYNFGSDGAKTVFEAVGSKEAASANNGAAGKAATGLNLVNSAKIGGNVEFVKIQGQDGETNGSGAGGDGGNAYGIKLAANQSLTLENANVVFKNLVAGIAGQTTAPGANGKNIGIDIVATSTSKISGSGKIVFEGFDKADAPVRGAKTGATENTIINNAGTKLTLSGISIDAKGDVAITDTKYAIYNGIAGTKYVFGTETELQNYASGMILSADSTLDGALNITNALEAGTQENNNIGQENVTGLVIRSGSHNVNTLDLKMSSTNGNVTAIRLEGSTEAREATAAEMTLDGAIEFSLSAKDDPTNKIVVLENIGNSKLTGGIGLVASAFTGGAQKIILDNKGTLELASGKTFTVGNAGTAGVADNSYGIFAGIEGVRFNFGDSLTSFTGIAAGADANAGTAGKDTAAIYAAADLTLSGNASFASFAGQASKDQETQGKGANGGNAYGLTTAGADAVISFDNASLTFANLTGGLGGASHTDAASGEKSGDAVGVYAKTNNLTLQGSGSVIFGGNIEGGAAKAENSSNKVVAKGNAYIIQNDSADKVLTLSGVSVIAGTAEGATGSYGIYNNTGEDVVGNYVFGTKADGGTILNNGTASANTAGTDFTGMIVASSANVSGVLKVVGQNAVGQEQAPAGRATDDGLEGGDATGIMLTGDATALTLDTLTLNVNGGNGSDGASGKTNGKGGDAYGLVGSGHLMLKNGANTINVTAGDSKGTKGDAYGIKTTGALEMNADAGTLSLSVDGATNAFGLYLAGTSAGAANTIQFKPGADLNLVGTSATVGAIQGKVAYGIYNATDAKNELLGNVVFGDDSKKAAVGNNTATLKAYGLYNVGDLTLGDTDNATIEFKANALLTKTPSDGETAEKFHIVNKNTLTFGSGAAVFTGVKIAQSNLSASGSGSELNIFLDSDSVTKFNAGKAISVADGGKINITANAGSMIIFGENNQAFDMENGSEINLTLGEPKAVINNIGATLVFGGEAGTLNVLKGSKAEILLSGDEATAKKRLGLKSTFAGRTLTIKDMQLSGSNFVLAASSKTMDSDKVVVAGTKDATASVDNPINNNLYVILDDYATSSEKPAVLATVADAAKDKVIFNNLKNGESVNSEVYKGFTTAEIRIVREDTASGASYTSDLRTTNVQVNSDFIAPTTAALSAGISLFSANLNSLSKRMGELRNNPYEQGAWARVFSGEQTTNFGAKQSTVYTTVQAGYDYKLDLGDAANYIGAAISYTKGMGGQVNPTLKVSSAPLNLPVAGLTSSNTDGVEVAVYNSYVANSGLYSDSIVKFGYYMTDLTMPYINDPYSTSNLALAVSEEIGYKVSLGESNEWFITPQGEVAFAYIGGTEFTQDFGGDQMKSTQDATSLLRARVGAAWGYDFSHLAKESDVKASIYLGTYYTYDYFIGGDTTLSTVVNGNAVEYKHNAYEGTGRFVMNLGTNIDVQDRTKVYFDFEKSFGGNIQTDYQVSLGVRFGIGEKISAPKKEETKATEAALKPKELEESAE